MYICWSSDYSKDFNSKWSGPEWVHVLAANRRLMGQKRERRMTSTMESFHQRFGTKSTVDDIANLGTEDIQQYDTHEDGSQSGETFPSSELR